MSLIVSTTEYDAGCRGATLCGPFVSVVVVPLNRFVREVYVDGQTRCIVELSPSDRNQVLKESDQCPD